MSPHELIGIDRRVHLTEAGEGGGLGSVCGAPVEGLSTTSMVLWATCSRCLVGSLPAPVPAPAGAA